MMNIDVKILFREKNLIKKNLLMNLLMLIKIYEVQFLFLLSLILILILYKSPRGGNELNQNKQFFFSIS